MKSSSPLTRMAILGLILITAAGCGGEQKQDAATKDVDLSQVKDLFAPAPAAPAADPATVVLTVNGQEITRGMIDTEGRMIMNNLRGRIPPDQMAQYMPRIQQQAQEAAVVKALLLSEVEAKNIEADSARIDEIVEKMKTQLPEGDTLDARLAKQGTTLEELRKNIARELRVETLITAEVGEPTEPTEEEIKTYYDENPKRFARPERVAARHILIAFDKNETDESKAAKKERAESLKAKLDEGADFAKLATENSDCPSSKHGGDLGTFPRGRMVPAFEKAAFSQKVGEIGDVIETQFGYHIIEVTERHEADTAKLEEVKEGIASMLKSQAYQLKLQDYIKGLKDAADIQQAQPVAPVAAPTAAPVAAAPVAAPVTAAPAAPVTAPVAAAPAAPVAAPVTE